MSTELKNGKPVRRRCLECGQLKYSLTDKICQKCFIEKYPDNICMDCYTMGLFTVHNNLCDDCWVIQFDLRTRQRGRRRVGSGLNLNRYIPRVKCSKCHAMNDAFDMHGTVCLRCIGLANLPPLQTNVESFPANRREDTKGEETHVMHERTVQV